MDAVITDPPYAEVDRAYGRLSSQDWRSLMDEVVREVRRVLKPSGSAVFILQPNSERVGRMRPWLFEFAADYAREWNLIQDIYWWNTTTPPNVHTQARYGLLRPSVKWCLWFGEPDCYRNQEAILWSPSEAMLAESKSEDWELRSTPSGYGTRPGRIADRVRERGRVTPFNLLPISNAASRGSAGALGHGAGTPLALCDWFTRYLVPPGGTVLDCFAGTGTTGIAAISLGKSWIGIEQDAAYVEIAHARLTGDFSTIERADLPAHEEQNRLFT